MKKHLAIKVTNKYENEVVQKSLFDMGFKWQLNNNQIIDFSIEFAKNQSIYLYTNYSLYLYSDITWNTDRYSNELYKFISSSDFFSIYAGHIEKFPDYEPEQTE